MSKQDRRNWGREASVEVLSVTSHDGSTEVSA